MTARIRSVVRVAAFVVAALLVDLVLDAAQAVVVIDVDEPRQLAEVLDALERRHKQPITYEDPPYLYSGDLKDVASTVRKNYRKGMPPVLVPVSGRFTFSYTPPGLSEPIAGVVDELVKRYNTTPHAGRFSMIRGRHMLHVVPKATRQPSGSMAPVVPVLDGHITMPEAQRSLASFTEAFAATVSERAGVPVSIASLPTNLFHQNAVTIGAVNEPARDVLARALASVKRPLSWRLFYSPDHRRYFLSIHIVPPPERPRP